jgi:SsrA-binding protein
MSTEKTDPHIKPIATNRQARRNYHISETHEAGIALRGTEVKSLRAGNVQLRDAYAKIVDGEVWLYNAHISPYEFGNIHNHDPLRPRKLLMHRQEIRRLCGKTAERGFTLVPTRMYFKRGKAKVELGLGKGKLLHDKREDIKARDAQLEMKRAMGHQRET